MRPDPGREQLERIHQGLSPNQRALIGQELRQRGFLSVWDQVDRTEAMAPVEEAMFVLARLYPEMPATHRASLRRQMQARYDAGTWRGFERPSPLRRTG